jgi:predicted small lipoprotein YifL
MAMRLITAALIGLALTGCGLKDDLYLPEPAAEASPPPAAAGEPPANSDSEQDEVEKAP